METEKKANVESSVESCVEESIARIVAGAVGYVFPRKRIKTIINKDEQDKSGRVSYLLLHDSQEIGLAYISNKEQSVELHLIKEFFRGNGIDKYQITKIAGSIADEVKRKLETELKFQNNLTNLQISDNLIIIQFENKNLKAFEGQKRA